MAAGRKDHDALAWFADELRAHRNTHGWTQADLAAKISYSESLIAQVETGRKAPTPELARAASDRILVRDSKNPDGGRLGFSAQAWREFAATIKGRLRAAPAEPLR